MLPFLTHQYILLLAAGSDSKKRFCPVVQLCPLSVRRKRSKEEAKWKKIEGARERESGN